MYRRDKRTLLDDFPEIYKEWDYEKNKLKPENYNIGSHEKIWWLCLKCNHSWLARINDRTSIHKSGCPRCSNRYIDETNCLLTLCPELCKEWDYNKNDFEPSACGSGSHKRAWWICSKCNYEYKTFIYHRALGGHGCARCAGIIVNPLNSLLVKAPDLCKEWHFNKNQIGPEAFAPCSSKKVWWICLKCNYEWAAVISDRFKKKSGCSNCMGRILNETNSLLFKLPELCKEWNSKNELGPSAYTFKNSKKVWWICLKCNYEWCAAIYDRTRTDGKETGCPKCNKYYSKKCSNWIDSFNNNNIQKSFKIKLPNSKHKIEADGFDATTNTFYEFYGDEFHGNPATRNHNDISKITHKTYGDMYNHTMKREELIKGAGYNLVIIWENEWDQIIKGDKI